MKHIILIILLTKDEHLLKIQFAYIHKTFKTKLLTDPQQQYFP